MDEFEDVGDARLLPLALRVLTTNVRTNMLDEQVLIEADMIGIGEAEVLRRDVEQAHARGHCQQW
ncbi:hypothetical protein PMAYCL1PPCAC_00405, partial [Pristionchus mayeri]